MPAGELVALVQSVDHLEIIVPGRSTVHACQARNCFISSREGTRIDRLACLQQLMNFIVFERFRTPELLHRAAEHASAAEHHQLLEQRQRAGVGDRRQAGGRGGDVDGAPASTSLRTLAGNRAA